MHIKSLFAAAALGLSACALPSMAMADEVFDAPVATRQANETGLQTAIFAGGCFWGIEGIFSHTRGVTSAVSGYHGGTANTATYRQVVSGTTGHAEAVEITYDPSKISYGKLLQIFFSVAHDPTQLNRQGPDVGTQYRSAVYVLDEEQRKVVDAYIGQLDETGAYSKPIVTEVAPFDAFYRAEDYHQDYMLKNPRAAYIVRWDAPKVEALEEMFPQFYRARFRTG